MKLATKLLSMYEISESAKSEKDFKAGKLDSFLDEKGLMKSLTKMFGVKFNKPKYSKGTFTIVSDTVDAEIMNKDHDWVPTKKNVTVTIYDGTGNSSAGISLSIDGVGRMRFKKQDFDWEFDVDQGARSDNTDDAGMYLLNVVSNRDVKRMIKHHKSKDFAYKKM
jgi:hypothetical protein